MANPIDVLIVEDEAPDAELMERELRRGGFAPVCRRVETEDEFRAQLAPGVDVILADYTLPRFNAPRALEILAQTGLDIPLILVSGTIGEMKAVDCMKLGAADYLLKDRLARLGPAVTQVLEARALRRKQRVAEENLRASEERFRLLFDQAPLGYQSLDADGRFIEVNRTWLEMTGYTRAEVIGRGFSDFLEKGSAERFRQSFSAFKCEGEVCGVEFELRCKDGSRFTAAFTGRVAHDEAGGFKQTHCIVQDVTRQRQAEQALRQSEENFRRIVENAHEGVWSVDGEFVTTFVNARMAAMLGYTVDEMLGKRSLDFMHEEEREKHIHNMTARRQGLSETYERRYRHKDGSPRWMLTSATPLMDHAGRFTGSFAMLADITERKATELNLRLSEARYRTLVENIPFKVFMKDRGLEYVSVNREYADALRMQPEDVVGKTDFDLYSPELAEANCRSDRQVIESGERLQYDEEHTADGRRRVFHMVKVPVRDNVGKITGVLGTFSDITERRLLEEQLRHSQKMEAVGRLSGGVAHDFNNMLGVILGFTELAITKLPAEDPVQMYLHEVRTAARRSADITRQLLAFARKQTIAPRVLDLNDTIASMLKMLRRLIGEDIELLWKPARDLWQVKVDPAQIDQVLANLMVNARDAIGGVGKIIIETAKAEFDADDCERHAGAAPGRYVRLTVSDDGCGMDKETLAKIFEPFFTTKEAGKGTGLGLATVYGIVKQNNGFVDVQSTPGRGTTFKIYLPSQAPQAVEAGEPHAPAEVATGKETVLLVEDEASLLKFAGMLLEELGYTVLAAGGPREALGLAKEYPREIHLLMTDVVMPKMSGRDLCEQIAASRPGLKCLYMSGYTADVIAQQGVLEEGVHFLQKPFSREALARKIREALS